MTGVRSARWARWWRPRALVATLFLVTGLTAAQEWTVQTVALRDLREAEQRAQELLTFGYDAYTEFAMSDGQQYVRVRVGCYATRAGAEALAEALQGEVTEEAVPVEREGGGTPRACIRRDVGFRSPGSWEQIAPGVPAFRVEVNGVEALVRLRQGRWQVLQSGALEALPEDAANGASRFAQARGPGGPWVRQRVGGRSLYVCPGRLLAQDARVAVVEHQDAVMACHLMSDEP